MEAGVEIVEPGARRRWLIRSGLVKAHEHELPWLVESLRGDHGRSARRRMMWPAASVLAAAVAMMGIVVVVGTPMTISDVPANVGLSSFSVALTIQVGIPGIWAPKWLFKMRRRSILAAHGLDDRGVPVISPKWSARLTPRWWSLIHAGGLAILFGGSAAAALVYVEPHDVELYGCGPFDDGLGSSEQLAVSGEVVNRRLLGYPPEVEFVDEGTGEVLGRLRVPGRGSFAVGFTPDSSPTGDVRCRLAS